MDKSVLSNGTISRKSTWDIQDEVDALIKSYAGKLEATVNVEPKIRHREPDPLPTEMRLMSMRAFKRAEKGTGTKFMIELCKIADRYNLVITAHLADKGWSGDDGYDIIDKRIYKSTESTKRLIDFYKRFGFKRGSKSVSDKGFPFGNIHRMPHAKISANESTDDPFIEEENTMDNEIEKTVENFNPKLKEYFVGQSAGYGGGVMTGGQVAPNNWAGTFSSNQTSRRLNDYPASRRYTYMQGNTVIGSSLYDTITQDDLKHPKFSAQEIFTGLRKEMSRMEYPDKDVAKQTVLANLEKNPKFYSDLQMYFDSDKQGNNIMENIDQTELQMGVEVEKEHTSDEALATKIAMDHLKEDPMYYTKLNQAGLGHGNELGSVKPVAPSVAVVTLATTSGADAGQNKLGSSGLGQSGTPKPLQSTNLEAPIEKNKVGPNKVAVTKTPSFGEIYPQCDALDHFGSQMVEKW